MALSIRGPINKLFLQATAATVVIESLSFDDKEVLLTQNTTNC